MKRLIFTLFFVLWGATAWSQTAVYLQDPVTGVKPTIDINGLKVNTSGSGATGTLTNNNAAPSTANLGVLPCVANAAAPSWTEGRQVLCSVDLSGNTRITGNVAAQAVNGAGAVTPIACNSTAIYDGSTAATTKVISLSGSKVTYICGYTIFAAGTVNVSLTSGTNTKAECDTSIAALTPAFQLTTQSGIADGSTFFRGLKAGAGLDTCVITTQAVAVQIIIYYTQI